MAEFVVDFYSKHDGVRCEQVVRCRDCEHFVTNIHGSYCKMSISTTSDPNGFCAWGKRREDA